MTYVWGYVKGNWYYFHPLCENSCHRRANSATNQQKLRRSLTWSHVDIFTIAAESALPGSNDSGGQPSHLGDSPLSDPVQWWLSPRPISRWDAGSAPECAGFFSRSSYGWRGSSRHR